MSDLEDKVENIVNSFSKKQKSGDLKKYPVWLNALQMEYLAGALLKLDKLGQLDSQLDADMKKGIFEAFYEVRKSWNKKQKTAPRDSSYGKEVQA